MTSTLRAGSSLTPAGSQPDRTAAAAPLALHDGVGFQDDRHRSACLSARGGGYISGTVQFRLGRTRTRLGTDGHRIVAAV